MEVFDIFLDFFFLFYMKNYCLIRNKIKNVYFLNKYSATINYLNQIIM